MEARMDEHIDEIIGYDPIPFIIFQHVWLGDCQPFIDAYHKARDNLCGEESDKAEYHFHLEQDREGAVNAFFYANPGGDRDTLANLALDYWKQTPGYVEMIIDTYGLLKPFKEEN